MRRWGLVLLLTVSTACGREGASDLVQMTTPSPSATLVATSPAPTARTTPTPTPTAEPTPACRDSCDPRCGTFRWDPEPQPNEDLAVQIDVEPSSPRVGEDVTFTVTARDDHGHPVDIRGEYAGRAFANETSCAAQRQRYGPWTPPVKSPKTVSHTWVGTYDEAGKHTATFTFSTDHCNDPPYNPYGSVGTGSAVVTVRD
jgi:hypothetical protein